MFSRHPNGRIVSHQRRSLNNGDSRADTLRRRRDHFLIGGRKRLCHVGVRLAVERKSLPVHWLKRVAGDAPWARRASGKREYPGDQCCQRQTRHFHEAPPRTEDERKCRDLRVAQRAPARAVRCMIEPRDLRGTYSMHDYAAETSFCDPRATEMLHPRMRDSQSSQVRLCVPPNAHSF